MGVIPWRENETLLTACSATLDHNPSNPGSSQAATITLSDVDDNRAFLCRHHTVGFP